MLPLGGGADGRSPIYVRRGQTVFYHTYALHRARELWGQDAAAFRPERWAELRQHGNPRRRENGKSPGGEEEEVEEEEGEKKGRPPAAGGNGGSGKGGNAAGTAWKFVPFGGGGRICPGRESSCLCLHLLLLLLSLTLLLYPSPPPFP